MSRHIDYDAAVSRAKLAHGDKYTYTDIGYTSAAGYITFNCAAHGEYKMLVADHWKGHGCKQCGLAKSQQAHKSKAHLHLAKLKEVHPTYEFPDYLQNYTLVTDKATVICPKHGEFKASTHHLKKGKGCPKCGRLKTADAKRWTKDNVISRLTTLRPDSPYTYFAETFTGYSEHMTFACVEHGKFTQTIEAHAQGAGCPVCAQIANSYKTIISPEVNLQRCRDTHGDAYSYPEDLTGLLSKWKIDCPTHGRFEQIGYVHIRGSKCPICAGMGSRGQRELLELVRSVHPDAISDYRFSKTSRQQIDVYIPSLNLGFEYDGIYWHSSAHKENMYHRDKQLAVRAEGIELYQIFSDEWDRPAGRKLVTQRITKTKGVAARKCTVEEISAAEAQTFHNENHIQGSKLYGTSYALKHAGIVVAVMTFTHVMSVKGCKLQEGAAELARYSTSIRVVGGASKLFAHAVKAEKLTKVISYSDNRLFNGAMYQKLQFNKEHVTPPNYSYCGPNNPERLHKSRFRHSRLPALLGEAYNPELTEKANCEAAGYYQVYDCGLTKWQWASNL